MIPDTRSVFEVDAALRARASFPTRRSADLEDEQGCDPQQAKHAIRGVVAGARRNCAHDLRGTIAPRASYHAADGVRSEEHTSNSSHANISYTVFCLTKKTPLIYSSRLM